MGAKFGTKSIRTFDAEEYDDCWYNPGIHFNNEEYDQNQYKQGLLQFELLKKKLILKPLIPIIFTVFTTDDLLNETFKHLYKIRNSDKALFIIGQDQNQNKIEEAIQYWKKKGMNIINLLYKRPTILNLQDLRQISFKEIVYGRNYMFLLKFCMEILKVDAVISIYDLVWLSPDIFDFIHVLWDQVLTLPKFMNEIAGVKLTNILESLRLLEEYQEEIPSDAFYEFK